MDSTRQAESMIDEVLQIVPPENESFRKSIEEFYLRIDENITLRRNSKRQTLLHAAAGFGKVNLVSRLIKQGANVDAQDDDGKAPLHNACNHGHYTTSMKLIKAGANVNLRDKQGWTALHSALQRRTNAERITPEYWRVVELLLESGADPFIKSYRSNKTCLSRINDDEQRRTVILLHIANELKKCESSDQQIREAVINRFLYIEDFFELVKLGDEHLPIIEKILTRNLLKSRLESFDNITPLHRAAGYNHLGLAKLFIDEGISVDTMDGCGRIALHNAAEYGHVDMIELLVNEGSDINKRDKMGYSPLHVAASNRTFIACSILIRLGADKNLRCNEGLLPYDLAEADDIRKVLEPHDLKHNLEMIPSTSERAIYIDIQAKPEMTKSEDTYDTAKSDELMLDSSSTRELFSNTRHYIKILELDKSDIRYQLVKQRMLNTIRVHDSDSGGRFNTYSINSIELVLNKKVWTRYKFRCKVLEETDKRVNEKLLFHGSNSINNIQLNGFDERHAQRDGMFGAGIYFAEHSSKSNQYSFGWNQGCREHQDKSCYKCERKMVYAQVALGLSHVPKEPISCAHAPPGFSSVTGKPGVTKDLTYKEYVIYNGEQAYPLFVISYQIENRA